LHGLKQLPGLAVQRLMSDGYGFGGEGDWKTCALVRAMKAIASDLSGGTSFMEDYTYHLHPDGHLVLGSHMLEVVSLLLSASLRWKSIRSASAARRILYVSFLMRLPVRRSNASLIDLGNRFRPRSETGLRCTRAQPPAIRLGTKWKRSLKQKNKTL
jgi:L-arabinose isomerase